MVQFEQEAERNPWVDEIGLERTQKIIESVEPVNSIIDTSMSDIFSMCSFRFSVLSSTNTVV